MPRFRGLYENVGRAPATTVAASNAPSYIRNSADYVCDGTADEVQIQAALTANIGRVVLSVGTFTLSDEIAIAAGRSIEGQGYSTQLAQSVAEKNVFIASGDNASIRHLRVTGYGTGWVASDKSNGIYASAVRDLVVESCYLNGFSGCGIQLRAVSDVRILNNILWGNTGSGTESDIITYSSGSTKNRLTIQGNYCLSNNSQGIFVSAIGFDTDILIADNVCVALNASFAEVALGSLVRRHGIIASYNGGASRVSISGNLLRNTQWSGIYVTSDAAVNGPFLIMGNYISDVSLVDSGSGLNGGIMVVAGGEGDLISGNIIHDVDFGAGIKVEQVASSAVAKTLLTQNIIRGCVIGIFLTVGPRETEILGNTILNSTSTDIQLVQSAGFTGICNLRILHNRIIRNNTTSQSIYLDPVAVASTKIVIRSNFLTGFGTGGVAATNVGIYYRYTSGLIVKDNTIENFQTGVYIESYFSGRTFQDIVVDDNFFYTLINGIVVSGVTTIPVVPFEGNRFETVTNELAGITGAPGVGYIARRLGLTLVLSQAAAPTIGTWAVGDSVYHTVPTAGGNIGAVCVTAGNPGTWKTFGVIAG